MFRLLARTLIGTLYNNCASTSIGTGSWVELLSSLPVACSAIEIFNPSDAKVQISIGAAADEANHILPYTVLPGGSSGLIPAEIARGKRISAKAIDQAIASDYFVINFFG